MSNKKTKTQEKGSDKDHNEGQSDEVKQIQEAAEKNIKK